MKRLSKVSRFQSPKSATQNVQAVSKVSSPNKKQPTTPTKGKNSVTNITSQNPTVGKSHEDGEMRNESETNGKTDIPKIFVLPNSTYASDSGSVQLAPREPGISDQRKSEKKEHNIETVALPESQAQLLEYTTEIPPEFDNHEQTSIPHQHYIYSDEPSRSSVDTAVPLKLTRFVLEEQKESDEFTPSLDDIASVHTSKSDDDTSSVRTEDFITVDGEVKEDALLHLDDDQSTIGEDSTIRLGDLSRTTLSWTKTSVGVLATNHSTKTKSRKNSSQVHNHVITDKNFHKMDWNNWYEALTIRNSLFPITETNLAFTRGTLSSLKFSKVTSFQIVLCFLRNCPNLERLSFMNTKLIQKRQSRGNSDGISLTKLKELELSEWIFSLTKDEYWLLDFFCQFVTFPKLESFVLRGSENFQWEKSVKKSEKELRKIKDPSVVIKFIIKNSSTLQKISLGGLGFQMVGSDDTSRFMSQIAQVDSLVDVRIPLNANGINLVLQSQKRLHRLTCSGFLSVFNENPKLMIYTCVERNCNSLESIGIFPCVLQQDSLQSHSIYEFKCECLKKCHVLKNFFLNVTKAERAFSTRRSCAKVTNLQELPTSLVTIEIYSHKFDRQELQELGKRLKDFTKLRRLALSTNLRDGISIPLQWIQDLFSIAGFHIADFFGGQLENRGEVQGFLRSEQGQHVTMIEILDCISFHRNFKKQ